MLFRRRFLIASAKERLNTWLSALANSSTNRSGVFSFFPLTKFFAKISNKSGSNNTLSFLSLTDMFAESNIDSSLDEKMHAFPYDNMKPFFSDQKTKGSVDSFIAKAVYCHHKALQKSNLENNKMIPYGAEYGEHQGSIPYALRNAHAFSGRAEYCAHRADSISKSVAKSKIFKKPVFADCYTQDTYDAETVGFKSCSSVSGHCEEQINTETYAKQSYVLLATFHASKVIITTSCVAGLKSCPANNMKFKGNLGTDASAALNTTWTDPVLKNNVLGVTQSRNVTQTDNTIHIA